MPHHKQIARDMDRVHVARDDEIGRIAAYSLEYIVGVGLAFRGAFDSVG